MRKKSSHKGENGKCLIIGGSKDYPGAAYLSGMAALRTGADIVKIACPEKVAWAINSMNPDLITIKLKGEYILKKHIKEIKSHIQKDSIMLIGPGLIKNSAKEIKTIIKSKLTKVIDADAIKIIRIQELENSILTCHKKEFEILLKNSKIKNITELKKQIKDNIVILKGNPDQIITKNKTYINKTGNEGMTVGGTGDILAGLTLGLLSQGFSKLESAKLATKKNGNIGDKLLKKQGYSFTASDFLTEMEKQKIRLTTDTIIFSENENEKYVLLVKRGKKPFKNKFCIPGGHLEYDESIEQCAKRELFEETRIKINRLKYLFYIDEPKKDPRGRVITFVHTGKVNYQNPKAGDDAKEAHWIKLKEAKKMKLAFNHNKILNNVLKKLKKQ